MSKVYRSKETVVAEEMTYHTAGKELIKDYDKDLEERDGYKIIYENSYESWESKDIFDTLYELFKDNKTPSEKAKDRLFSEIREIMNSNNNKIPFKFIEKQVKLADKIYLHPTPNTRICILTLQSGHEVVGIARVLDAKNDDSTLGNKVALEEATNELWSTLGSIAKLFV